ncbi:hypothetical protein NDU88_004768 [Pleurodeles waltl]|uniref:Uncharacterized protein n=1 Tax=Pleurodeles waltl TaxID=8319 RepID=A0AAV7TTN0_PLEWA|nr:hypothetical protein NDU88_004768 [Pleurodeles waltl]
MPTSNSFTPTPGDNWVHSNSYQKRSSARHFPRCWEMTYPAGPHSSSTPTAAQDDESSAPLGSQRPFQPRGAHHGPPSPQRDQPGPERAQVQLSGLRRARHGLITSRPQAAWSCPRRGTGSTGCPPTLSNGPRPGIPAPSPGLKGGHTGLIPVPDRSPGGAHRRPACFAHLSSSGLSLPPPGQ